MSAFIVNDDHISLLVTAAIDGRDLEASWLNQLPGAPDKPDDPDSVGQALLRENARSVMHRYRGDDLGGVESMVAYRFRRIYYGLVTPVVVLKSCDCYDYQACEMPDYEGRWASKWVQNLRKSIIHKLPGYDAAPWGFEAPENMPQVVSITDLARRSLKR